MYMTMFMSNIKQSNLMQIVYYIIITYSTNTNNQTELSPSILTLKRFTSTQTKKTPVTL